MRNENLLIFANSSLLALFIFGIPFSLTLFLLFFSKKKLSENSSIYLYAFASGLLIILSTFGLIKEGAEKAHIYVELIGQVKKPTEHLYSIGIVGGGVFFGLILAILMKIFIFKTQTKKANKINQEFLKNSSSACCVVNIDEMIKEKGIFLSLLVISGHRFIDGLSLGLLSYDASGILDFKQNWGNIITFIIHDIPLSVIIFYMQRQTNVSKKKILLYAAILPFITIPFIYVGAFLSSKIENSLDSKWIIPLLFSFSGSILLFNTLMGLVPEFIHNQHLCSRHWYSTVMWLCLGIMLSLILGLIHIHKT